MSVLGEGESKLGSLDRRSLERGVDECIASRGEMSSKCSLNSLQQDEHQSESLSTIVAPGFRFHPTDEELVKCYLMKKIKDAKSEFLAVGEVDFNLCEPWDLHRHAKIGQNMFYFLSLRELKYPTGSRANRATACGYWKATGKDRQVMEKDTGKLVGMKKTLVFYTGRAPKGVKTDWVLHEYRIATDPDQSNCEDSQWVICRAFLKSSNGNLRVGSITSETSETCVDKSPYVSIPCDALTASSLDHQQFQPKPRHLPNFQSIESPRPATIRLAVPQTSLYGNLDSSLDNVSIASLWEFADFVTPDHQL